MAGFDRALTSLLVEAVGKSDGLHCVDDGFFGKVRGCIAFLSSFAQLACPLEQRVWQQTNDAP